jgi:LysR family glycine cleavage system transcriptional activator
MPRLHQFLAREPRLQIRLLTTLWTPLELDRDADFEIRCGIGSWPNLSAYELTRDHLFPVCASRLIEKMPRPLLPEILRGRRLIHVQGFAEGWKEWLASTGDATLQASTRRLMFDTATLAIELTLNAGGFMMGRSCFVAPYLADGRLVAPFTERLKSVESFYLVERAGERLPMPARLFRDWILAEAAR